MRNLTWAAPAMLLGMQICASADTIVLGTQIQIRMDRPIELRASERERVFPARVAQDVYAGDWNIAIRRGSDAELIVRQIDRGQVEVDLLSVTVNDTRWVPDTNILLYSMPSDSFQSRRALISRTGGASLILIAADSAITFQFQKSLRVS